MDQSLKYKWFYESLQQVDKTLNKSVGIDDMLDDVVETVLDIFGCDRAWLFHPCDPEADNFDVTVESNTPQYPGAKSQQVSVPMTPDMAGYCRRALEQPGEVMVDPEPGYEISNDIALRFSVQSLTFMALHPRVGDPWMFGMHQCDHPRQWSHNEKELFSLIGRRLQDALSNKLSLERVAASEKTLRQLASAGWEAVVVHEDGAPILANEQYYSMFGYSPEEILGKPAMEMTTTPESLQKMRSLIAAGELGPYEAVGVRKDGATFPMEIKAREIRYQGKDVRVAAIRDVTRYKRVEEELRSSQEQFRAIFDSTSDFVFLKDSNLRYVKVNPAMERLFGRPARELEGHTDRELFGDEAGEHIEEMDGRVLRGETLEEEDTKPVNEKLRTFNVKKAPVLGSDGKAIGLCGIARDVTERKQVEDALRESEEKYRQLVQFAPAGIYEVDLSAGKFISVNDVMCQYTGYTRDEFLELNPMELLSEDSRLLFMERLQKIAKGEEVPDTVEFQIQTKNGSIIWALLNSRIQHFDSGEVRASVVAYDITDRKQVEEMLLKERKFLDRLMETSPVSLVVVNREGQIIMANATAEKNFGLKQSDIYKRTYDDPDWRITDYHGNPFPEEELPFEIVKRTESVVNNIEHAIELSDGRRILLSINSAPLFDGDGEFDGIVSAIDNVTERKLAEKALRESEDFLNRTGDMAQVGGWEVDLGTMKVVWTQTTGRIHELPSGYYPDLEEAISYYHPDDQEHVRQCVQHAIDSAEPFDFTVRLITAKGRERWVRALGQPVFDSGRCVRLSGTFQDITERLKLESQLHQAQKMEAIGTLAGGIAHDFNNILAAVMGYAEISLEEIEQGKASPETVKNILVASDRAKSLVQQILTFSRRADAERVPVDLNKEILSSSNLLKQTLPKMIDIRLELSTEISPVLASPHQVEQILMNLGTNARDAMPDGGTLTIATTQQRLDGETCQICSEPFSGEYVVITVTDTGQGIIEEDLDNIFDPFFTTKEVGKGTGLGLSTVFGIVSSYGGHINCISRRGRGTTFNIYLPPSQDEIDDAGEATPTEAIEGGDETILLVDDEAHILHIGDQHLSRAGYKVLTAPNGEEALGVFKSMRDEIALAILDLSMPGMGGHKCLRELLSLSPDLKVIVSTGYSRDGDLQETMSSGAAAQLSKPFSKNEMLKTVRMVLDA